MTCHGIFCVFFFFFSCFYVFFFFQAEDGIRDRSPSRGLGDVYKRQIYHAMISLSDGMYSMNEEVLISSLKILSELLYKHYGKKTILLIDEYDVPLDKAFQNGYYKEMTTLIRGMFGEALKTNDSLQFAVSVSYTHLTLPTKRIV